MKKITIDEFAAYLNSLKINRAIKRIQLHHTYSPSYKHFTGNNHKTLQENMRNYHMKSNGWSDIGQHFTIFPDGVIMTGRDINKSPAGISGANTGAICIECVGNFDKGGDVMTESQKTAIVAAVKILIDRFKLNAADGVVYHAWYKTDGTYIGDYVSGKSSKTCPGTNFFGGNTKAAYKSTLQPLIENYGKEEKKMLETGNDIVWELMNGALKIEISDAQRAIKALDDAKNNTESLPLYWIIYKIVNKGR